MEFWSICSAVTSSVVLAQITELVKCGRPTKTHAAHGTRMLSRVKMASNCQYPDVRRDESCCEELHGVKVEDPYRWLEDPDSEETAAFVKAQNELSEPFITSSTIRNQFHQRSNSYPLPLSGIICRNIEYRMTELYDYPKYGTPFKRGQRYFYFMNTGLQNQR